MHETLALGVASSGGEGSGHPAHGGQHHASPFEETQAAQEEVHRPSHDTGHACSDAKKKKLPKNVAKKIRFIWNRVRKPMLKPPDLSSVLCGL